MSGIIIAQREEKGKHGGDLIRRGFAVFSYRDHDKRTEMVYNNRKRTRSGIRVSGMTGEG